MPVKEIEDEIREKERLRKFIYSVALIALVIIAVFLPERYAVLCFLGVVVATLFDISTNLVRTYYLKRAQTDVVTDLLLTIVSQLNKPLFHPRLRNRRPDPENGGKGLKRQTIGKPVL